MQILEQFLYSSYQKIIDPYINTVFYENQTYKSAAYCSIAAVTYTTGVLLSSQFLTGIAGLALSSNITQIISILTNSVKATFEDSVFEEYLDYINPLIDLASAVVLRQAAAGAINCSPSSTGSSNPFGTSFTFQNFFNSFSAETFESVSTNVFSKVSSLPNIILNFGNITDNNQSNIVSTALNMAAFYTTFNSVLQLGAMAIFNIIKYFNITQQNALSVYDIKKIMSAKVGYKITREEATNLYNKFQACDEYYNNKNDATKLKIDIITGIHSRAYGDKQKELIKKSISNEFLDKSFKLIDMQTQFNVLQRLMYAEANLSTIKEFNKMGLIINPAERMIIKNTAITKLNTELYDLKQLCDISQNEELTYKSLYARSANIEVELDTLEELMWHALETTHELTI